MNRFAELLDRLAYEPGRNNKLRLIADYLRSTEDPDRGWALAALTGALSFKHAKAGMVRALITERADPVLILARSVNFGWPTVKAVINSRPGPKPSQQVIDAAHENFERLTTATAQRVVRFWQVRQGTGE